MNEASVGTRTVRLPYKTLDDGEQSSGPVLHHPRQSSSDDDVDGVRHLTSATRVYTALPTAMFAPKDA
jgi:hypothetical protein